MIEVKFATHQDYMEGTVVLDGKEVAWYALGNNTVEIELEKESDDATKLINILRKHHIDFKML